MESCEQAPGLNMLQHGESVHRHYKELIASIERGERPEFDALYSMLRLPAAEVLKAYHIYHDCGKPLCLTVVDGKRQYPHHAAVSAEQYLRIFPTEGFTAALIKNDMNFHIMKGDDLLKFCKSPFAPILYFTAWAEIAANAEMFGGTQSESYKIKRSRLIQSGKKLLNSLKGN